MSFFYQSQNIEITNQDKLVSINVARSTLEQLRVIDTPTFTHGEVLPECSESSATLCSPVINGITYSVTLNILETNNQLNLIPIEITVQNEYRQRSQAKVEGYVHP